MSDLTQFRDHCRRMAKKNTDAGLARLWSALADEIDDYLAPDATEEPLL